MKNIYRAALMAVFLCLAGCGFFFEKTLGDGIFNPKLKDEYRPLAGLIIGVIGIERPAILAGLVNDLRAMQREVDVLDNITAEEANRLIAANLNGKAALYAQLPEFQAAYGDVIELLENTELTIDEKKENFDVRLESLIQALESRIILAGGDATLT